MSLGLQSQQSLSSQPVQDTSQSQNVTGPSAAGSNTQAQEKLQAAPAASANQVSGNPSLQLNSRGKAVKTLQARLNELGASVDVDGEFGPATMRAVRGFQNANSIGDDGIVGPRTATVMNGNPAKIGSKPKGKANNSSEGGGGGGSGQGTEDTKDLGAGMKEGQLSANFSLAEFASHDGATTPANVVSNLRRLAAQLEVLREALGNASISINSGYRSPRHNRAVGGAENSQHMYGIAADVVVSGYTPKQVASTIEKLIKEGKMTQGGIGRYSTFVHYDIRGSAARW